MCIIPTLILIKPQHLWSHQSACFMTGDFAGNINAAGFTEIHQALSAQGWWCPLHATHNMTSMPDILPSAKLSHYRAYCTVHKSDEHKLAWFNSLLPEKTLEFCTLAVL